MTPKAVVNAIEAQLGVTGSPCQLRDAIEQVLLAHGLSAVAAAEQVDQLRRKVIEEIGRLRDAGDRLGEITTLSLRGGQDEIVHGSSYVFGDDSQATQQTKLNRISADEIHRHIQSLSFAQFEMFGRCVLRELGCTPAKVTPHAGDQISMVNYRWEIWLAQIRQHLS